MDKKVIITAIIVELIVLPIRLLLSLAKDFK